MKLGDRVTVLTPITGKRQLPGIVSRVRRRRGGDLLTVWCEDLHRHVFFWKNRRAHWVEMVWDTEAGRFYASKGYGALGLLILATVVKTGRCANGSHLDAGLIVHAAWVEPESGSGDWGPALCGALPGRLSSGWERVDRAMSCARCTRKAGVCIETKAKGEKP